MWKHTLSFAALLAATSFTPAEEFVIDDFSDTTIATIGSAWEGFTDGVMGGRSEMEAGYRRSDGGYLLRMRGAVSLENNGGFIQMELPLQERGTFDASEYRGVVVEARGMPGSYFVHIRTRRSRLPWQYYETPLEIGDEWSRVRVPFSDFTGESIRAELEPDRLATIAIVAAKAEFEADIYVRYVGFYR